jgi:leader peptidase (prepilin peptidase)/N-methyltransferase
MVRILGTLFAALAGLAFGSFLNVCLTRWPQGESIAAPRSHCRACGRTLKWWENIPFVSWLALRGRCRTCREWIGLRYPIVELSVGGLWGLIGWRLMSQIQQTSFPVGAPSDLFGFGIVGAIGMMIFSWMLVGLAVLDAEHFWLADAVTLPGIAAGIAYFVWRDELFTFGLRMSLSLWKAIGKRLLAAAAATLLILLIRWLYKLIRKREGIGLGDAKLMAMLAAWLGLPGALLSLFLGVTLGTVVALIVLALPSTHTTEEGWALRKLPLGTFLCVGGILSALWGPPIIAAYLRWAGL